MNPQRKASETRKKGPVRNESSEKNWQFKKIENYKSTWVSVASHPYEEKDIYEKSRIYLGRTLCQ
jgi:hypothetical protein